MGDPREVVGRVPDLPLRLAAGEVTARSTFRAAARVATKDDRIHDVMSRRRVAGSGPMATPGVQCRGSLRACLPSGASVSRSEKFKC